MAHFIKPSLWDARRKAPKEWLNLEQLILDTVSSSSTPTVGNNTITSKNSTIELSSSETINISYPGDNMNLEVILNTTSATLTFPLNSLCVSEGTASGDNTLALSGTSGDHYVIGIQLLNGTYYVVSKNFGQ